MLTIYVNKKSELTEQMKQYEGKGFVSYRSRAMCECAAPKNMRQCALLVDRNIFQTIIIRCKSCTARKEDINDNI